MICPTERATGSSPVTAAYSPLAKPCSSAPWVRSISTSRSSEALPTQSGEPEPGPGPLAAGLGPRFSGGESLDCFLGWKSVGRQWVDASRNATALRRPRMHISPRVPACTEELDNERALTHPRHTHFVYRFT